MSFNGSGLFTLNDTLDNGTLGDAVEVNNILTNIASGLSNAVCKDGQTTITANLPMNGFKFTGVAPGAARTDTATIANFQDGTGIYVPTGSIGGTANAITLLPSPAIAAYTEGQSFRFIVASDNTSGTVTVAVSGLAAKPLQSDRFTDVVVGDLVQGYMVEIYYDGLVFILDGGGRKSIITNRSIEGCTLVGCTTSPTTPTVASGIASKSYVDSMWTTGDVKVTLKTTADSGWVMFNDGTIGSASSGATTRANADTESLFTLLWTNTTDANCAVSSGRGASASADFAANKTIALPKVLGRALAVAGSGSGLSSRALAVALGSEDAITVAHTHNVSDSGHSHNVSVPSGGLGANNPNMASGADASSYTAVYTSSSSSTGVAVLTEGSSGTGANMQPTSFLNIMCKL